MKWYIPGQGGARIVDVDGQGECEVLKTGQFLWTSYVYHPLHNYEKCILLHLKSYFRSRDTQIFEFLTSSRFPLGYCFRG